VGLGLAICRAIVQAHGGSIQGSNRRAHGSAGARFTHRCHAAAAADDGTGKSTTAMNSPVTPAGYSILVVEDEADIRRFVRLALEPRATPCTRPTACSAA
jgi:hypothetical protein